MLINKKFILASSSKSRFKILKKNNLNFKKITPNCNEEKIKKKLLYKKTKPRDVVKKLAREKAVSVSLKNPNTLTVGCDTIILFNNEMIQKAKNLIEAQKKIKKLSGKKHKIVSAIAVYKNNTRLWEHIETTVVEIRNLTHKEIKSYLQVCGKDVLTSVGCYQIEKLGPLIIKKTHGDFFNVMGLPLFPFLSFLQNKKI